MDERNLPPDNQVMVEERWFAASRRVHWRKFLCVCVSVIAACSEDGGPSSSGDASGTADVPQGGGADVRPGGGPDAGQASVTNLTVEPARASLVVTSGVPVSQAFVVRATFSDGKTEDVTARASFRLVDPNLGTLTGPIFETAGRGGSTRLLVDLSGVGAEATIEVRVERIEDSPDGPTLPNDPGGIFGGAPLDTARPAPRIVYPNAETLLPPNLAGLEVHFRRGSSNDSLFRVRFDGAGVRLDVHTRCRPLGQGCLYALPPDLWRSVAGTVAGRGTFNITVEGTDDRGTSRNVSAPLEISVAARPVEGGLYYWSTSRQAILRVDFGTQGAPEQYFPQSSGGGPCYGCHALSPNGQKMTLSENGIGDGRMTLLDVATRNQLVRASNAIREQFQSWSPDSRQFAGVFGDGTPPSTQVRIRDGDTAQIVEQIELGFEPTHVDWSPAGDRIAFTRVTRHGSSQRPGRGGIAYVERSGTAWSAPKDLVAPADGFNHYTPAYAPDGAFLVYGRSQCPNRQIYASTCDGDSDPSSQLWAIPRDGGTPLLLARVNAPGIEDSSSNLSNTFPKWAPFVDARNADGTGRLMWFTFSSRRRYGLRPPVGSNQLLWMVAVDPEAILRGEDGSHSAFALPFQDLSTSNHIAQWTQRVVPTNPTDAGAGPDTGSCLPRGAECTPGQGECCPNLTCLPGAAGNAVCQRFF